ncbi:VOC family protein [Hymenobacter sp. H14-R3]|uniref:VOC family protein n=1 Tax=Hymenobacter sp. H14-R3 TaxID=3046308 RepID=UPI0024B9B0F3|nr:VOC family protein [Hymenobacter sp. H14-R3]MDJ0365490.1 VOC family protein [Hymenobacter sp. H14-R3]
MEPTALTSSATIPYAVPAGTSIGHIHLQVADIPRALAFYHGLLGFEVMLDMGSAVFLSADGYHHHIGLNTWHSQGGRPAQREGVAGLYHAAILYRDRAGLAAVVKRLLAAGYPLSGASDHGVSEAIYLNDPDGNGLELYWDRPRAEWPTTPDGQLTMYTRALDMRGLLAQ